MVTINTNLSSLIVQGNLKQATNSLNTAIERMTTGYKVNHASDNAANYSIATNINTKLGSLQVADENVSMSLDLVNMASGVVEELNSRVERLRSLQLQVENGVFSDISQNAINSEVNALIDEVENLYQKAEYNGITLFLESTADVDGSQYYEYETYAKENTTFEELEIGASSFSVYSKDGTLIQTYDVLESDTLGDFLSTLQSEGFVTDFNNGQIKLSSVDGKYIDGLLADELGVTTSQMTVVESTEQSFHDQLTIVDTSVNSTTTYVTSTIETTTTRILETVHTILKAETDTITPAVGAGFIQQITRRDTSTMIALSSVDSGVDLADGTYKISTTAELEQLALMTNADLISAGDEFVLARDIDLSSFANWTPIGVYRDSVEHFFRGTFDGNGYVIKNLTTSTTTEQVRGLFGYADGATFKNLGLVNVNVEGTSMVGALLGIAVDGGYINNCFVTGSVTGNALTGGLFGCSGAGGSVTIENSYSTADIYYSSNTGTPRNYGYIGGLAGYADVINNCFATSDVSGEISVGGLAGNASTVNDSFATGDVTRLSGYSFLASINGVGGLLGGAPEGQTITNCFATGDVIDENNNAAGGLIGYAEYSTITNCYATGNVVSSSNAGGVVGIGYSTTTITNCASTQSDSFATTKTEAEILSSLSSMGFTESNGWDIICGRPYLSTYLPTGGEYVSTYATVTTLTTLDNFNVIDAQIYLTDGSKINYTFTSASTFGDILTQVNNSGKGLTAELINGELRINGSNGVSIDSTTGNDNLFSAITLFNTTEYNTTTSTTTEVIRTESVTENVNSETIYTTRTVAITDSTKLNELGVNAPMLVTVNIGNTKSVINFNSNMSMSEFYAKLEEFNIETSVSGNTITFIGDGDVYINSLNFKNLFNLSDVSKTNGVKTFNTNSEKLFTVEKVYGAYAPGKIGIQVGTNGNDSSQIEFNMSFKLRGLTDLRSIGEDLETDYLGMIDEILGVLNAKQVEYGAMQNRLLSVLEEIAIQQDNLVSALSTIRDADMAEVSSEYIQQQILQQASATLLATANQTPALALQLL